MKNQDRLENMFSKIENDITLREKEKQFLKKLSKGTIFDYRDIIGIAFAKKDNKDNLDYLSICLSSNAMTESTHPENIAKYQELSKNVKSVLSLKEGLENGMLEKIMEKFKDKFPYYKDLGGNDKNILAVYVY